MSTLLPLLQQFDVPTPRYTSYPTVPFWESQKFESAKWAEQVKNRFEQEGGKMSIYIHLPFCESLCTFCACNKRITKNHQVEVPYIQSVIQEWELYLQLFPHKPVIEELHLGGGTPTFFSPESLHWLLSQLLKHVEVGSKKAFSVEVHPNYTTCKHLEILQSFGFNRISIGIQDFDPKVQYVINRVQSVEQTQHVVQWAREVGFDEINFDLIYGLPHQTKESIQFTAEAVLKMKPNRLAFYSYAHVPWKSKVQRRYTELDLPNTQAKWEMYQLGKEIFETNGFEFIGMDHFSLPEDSMNIAYKNGLLHRNFMGYTTNQNKLLVGLGASSIGDTWDGFAQNEKEISQYQKLVSEGTLPVVIGHHLTSNDLYWRSKILSLMCTGKTLVDWNFAPIEMKEYAFHELNKLRELGLISGNNECIQLEKLGQLFVRNICILFDVRLWEKKKDLSIENPQFSKAI